MKLRINPLFRIVTALAMLTGVIAATRISGWQTVTPENACSARHETTAVTVDEVFYLVGGNTNGHWNGFVPWLDSLDLKTGGWKRLPDAPHARDHFQAALVKDDLYYAAGCSSRGGGNERSAIEKMSRPPATNR